MKETQFQVITACKIDDSVSMRSEGFFEDEYSAYSHADSLRESMFNYCDCPYDVFVLKHIVDL